mmetsp:Transcript_19701/g.51116  ORF Transcript_19701/g.51116 Transcript_19701/m.51116 type:complete len:129 (+) Transcript_19701:1321-1707(+)
MPAHRPHWCEYQPGAQPSEQHHHEGQAPCATLEVPAPGCGSPCRSGSPGAKATGAPEAEAKVGGFLREEQARGAMPVPACVRRLLQEEMSTEIGFAIAEEEMCSHREKCVSNEREGLPAMKSQCCLAV